MRWDGIGRGEVGRRGRVGWGEVKVSLTPVRMVGWDGMRWDEVMVAGEGKG